MPTFSHRLLLSVTLALAFFESYGGGLSPQKSCFSPISWNPCPGAENIDCASYQVPLDYAHPSIGNATIALARFKAIKQPRLGTLFLNPGGPGGSGSATIQAVGAASVLLTNGQYDLVGWDPRGINQTTPPLTCGFASLDDFSELVDGTIVETGIEARGNFTDKGDLEQLFSMINNSDATLKSFGEKCKQDEFLKYMGTTTVVRDMVSVADCLEGPQVPINVYGVSYGTVIGNYFVNMFPKRVGRVILDGVIDSMIWATEPSLKLFASFLTSAELDLAGFAEKCAEAGSQNCAIAQNDSTADSILQDIHNLIDTAYDLHKAGKSNISSFGVRSFIYNDLHNPTTWDMDLAVQLATWNNTFQASQGNISLNRADNSSFHRSFGITRSHKNKRSSSSTGPADPVLSLALAGMVVPCLDSIDQAEISTKEVFNEIVRVTHEESPTFGELSTLSTRTLGFGCHRFPIRGVERFTGPFNHNLANTILVIGNKADPATPFANARKIAAALGNSARLIEQDGFGHTSLAENSDCTQSAMRAYLVNGTLPKNGQVCETDQALFPPNATAVDSLRN